MRVPRLDKFEQHFQRGDGCWIWTGNAKGGYGWYVHGLAHRTSYRLYVGEIPDGLELDHLCRTPLCVRPDHLEPVTRAENMRRRYETQTHCKRGHEFTEANTYLYRGHRTCRACQLQTVRRYQARRAAS